MYSMQINSTKKLLITQETEIYEWNLFIEIRAGNFRGTRSLLMRSLLRGAGSKQRRQESGRRILKKSRACW